MVADLEIEIRVGLNIMDAEEFQLDLKFDVLQVNEEEVILHSRQEDAVQMLLLEETVIR